MFLQVTHPGPGWWPGQAGRPDPDHTRRMDRRTDRCGPRTGGALRAKLHSKKRLHSELWDLVPPLPLGPTESRSLALEGLGHSDGDDTQAS